MPLARLPLASRIQSRTNSTTKDARLVNALVETEGDTKWVVKRPGLSALTVSPAIPSGQGQGLYAWNNYLIAAVANSIYLVTGQNSSTTLGSIIGTVTPLSFATVANDDYLAFHNGSNLYTINKGTPPTFSGGVGVSGGVGSVNKVNAGGYYGFPNSVTVATGSPSVIALNSHGLVAGQGVQFTATTMPDGMVAGTTYQVASVPTTSTFTIKTCPPYPATGTNINNTTTGTAVKVLVSPTVTFTGGSGTGAAGTASLYNHQVASVIVTAAGTGYTTGIPTITISAPPSLCEPSPSNASISFTTTYIGKVPDNPLWWNVTLNSIQITQVGLGYIDVPTITWTAGNFNTIIIQVPDVTITLNSGGAISNITINSKGLFQVRDGYSPNITGTVSAAPKVQATATAVMASSQTAGPFAPGLAYLNNRCFVMSKDGKVYQSDTNNPTLWNSSNFLTCSSDPDGGKGLVRHLNYLLAFGDWSTECLYDASNPTGSVLAVYQSGKLEIGCASGYSIAQAEQTVLWVGQSVTEGRSVYLMDGMSPVKVSTRYIEKYLNAVNFDSSLAVRAYCLKLSGHTLYVLKLTDQNVSFVYDLDEKTWTQWTSQPTDTTGIGTGVEGYFAPTSYDGNLEYQAGIYLQDDDLGTLYKMDSTYTTDNSYLIYVRVVTPIVDSGTTKRKFYRKVEVVGDKVYGNLSIRHSDDDYTTKSSYRTVSLLDGRPILYQCGSARRRSWELFYSGSSPLRLEALEIEFDIGEQGMGQEG